MAEDTGSPEPRSVSISDHPEVKVTGAGLSTERARAQFGAYMIWAFILGLAFFGLVIAAEIGLYAANRRTFLAVDDLVKVATTFGTIIGPPLGFVISYYFKERESGQS